MINLLPPQEKRGLKLIENQKRVSVILIHFLACSACLILVLFLLNHFISSKATELGKIVLAKNQELESYQFQGFREATLKLNQHLAFIQLFQREEISIGPFLEEISSLAPVGISFTAVSFRKDSRLVKEEGGSEASQKLKKRIFAEVHLTGIANTREVLYSFKKILEGEKLFQHVYFSPASWTAPRSAPFSVGFEALYVELPMN